MLRIPVRSHDSFGIYWFDPETASFTFEKASSEKDIQSACCLGWGSVYDKQNKRIVVIYYHKGTLFFQVNKQCWDLEDHSLKLNLTRSFFGLRNRFEVLYNKESQFVWHYWSAYINPLNLLDFPFSKIDEENTDFFAYLANNFNNKDYVKNFAESYV
jgi:hypothetical protein